MPLLRSLRRHEVLATITLSVLYFSLAVGIYGIQSQKLMGLADQLVPPSGYTVNPTRGPAPLTVSVEYPNFGAVKGGRAIDWGDGSPATTIVGATGRQSHTYPKPGSYLVNLQQCVEVCRKNERPTLLATVTVQSPGSPPTATLQGLTSVTTGTKAIFVPTVTAGSDGISSIKVYRSPKQMPNSWVELFPQACPSGETRSAGVPPLYPCKKDVIWDTTNEAIGDYYIVVNVADKQSRQCSGNAVGGTKDLWGNILTGWSDCGSASRLTVTLAAATVATVSPTTTSTISTSPSASPAGSTMPPLASPPTATTVAAGQTASSAGSVTSQTKLQLVATGGSLVFNLTFAFLLSMLTACFFFRRELSVNQERDPMSEA